MDKLATPLPNHIRNAIIQILIPLDDYLDDGRVWSRAMSGLYSLVAAYHWWMERNYQVVLDTSWSWLWWLKCLEKLKLALWLALHDSLPTNAFCHKRNLCASPYWPRCDVAPECALHCFRDY